jgi:hypothetical protein
MLSLFSFGSEDQDGADHYRTRTDDQNRGVWLSAAAHRYCYDEVGHLGVFVMRFLEPLVADSPGKSAVGRVADHDLSVTDEFTFDGLGRR